MIVWLFLPIIKIGNHILGWLQPRHQWASDRVWLKRLESRWAIGYSVGIIVACESRDANSSSFSWHLSLATNLKEYMKHQFNPFPLVGPITSSVEENFDTLVLIIYIKFIIIFINHSREFWIMHVMAMAESWLTVPES